MLEQVARLDSTTQENVKLCQKVAELESQVTDAFA